jgi:hypothetical protein
MKGMKLNAWAATALLGGGYDRRPAEVAHSSCLGYF